MSKVLNETPNPETVPAYEDWFYAADPKPKVETPTPEKDQSATSSDTETPAGPQTDKTDKVESKPAESAEDVAFKAKTGRRFQELLDRNKQLETELQQARQPKTEAATTLQAPVEPNPDTFTGTWDELKAANAKYAKDLVAYELQKDRTAQTEAQQQARIKEYNDGVTKVWNTRSAKTVERNADYRTLVQESDASPIKAELIQGINATANQFFVESEVGPDLLLYYAKHPEERAKLYAMGTRDCSRELIRMEDKIAEELKPAKKITDAPRAAADVTGSGGGLGKEKTLEDSFGWD